MYTENRVLKSRKCLVITRPYFDIPISVYQQDPKQHIHVFIYLISDSNNFLTFSRWSKP